MEIKELNKQREECEILERMILKKMENNEKIKEEGTFQMNMSFGFQAKEIESLIVEEEKKK